MEIRDERIDDILNRLARSRFRRRFRLGPKERQMVLENGLNEIKAHGLRFIAERLVPADPANDGRQTPMRGHPVFIAQHATAACCRGCLQKWHGIEKGAPLDEADIRYILDVQMAWIRRQVPDAADRGARKSLFDNPD